MFWTLLKWLEHSIAVFVVLFIIGLFCLAFAGEAPAPREIPIPPKSDAQLNQEIGYNRAKQEFVEQQAEVLRQVYDRHRGVILDNERELVRRMKAQPEEKKSE